MIRKALYQPYGSKEAFIIDDELLKRRIEHDMTESVRKLTCEDGGIDFTKITRLSLDLEMVTKINNMRCFTSLRKLCLRMNNINKIEGLDCLVNLHALDLSFNRINRIEGLDRLVCLEELNLSFNLVHTLENMSELRDLHTLLVTNNYIKDKNNIEYLRTFKKLKILSLKKNPLAKIDTYHCRVMAYNPWLSFLDGEYIKEGDILQAEEKFEEELAEITSREELKQRKYEEKQRLERKLTIQKLGYVDQIPSLLHALCESDNKENQEFQEFPEMIDVFKTYKKNLETVCQEILNYGQTEHLKRKAEIEEYVESISQLKSHVKEKNARQYEAFLKFKKMVMDKVHGLSRHETADTIKVDRAAILAEIDSSKPKLEEPLMILEEQLLNQLDTLFERFHSNMTTLVEDFIEKIQTMTSKCRELEYNYSDLLASVLMSYYERKKSGDGSSSIPKSLNDILIDKETVIAVAKALQDRHLTYINSIEDDVKVKARDGLQSILKEMKNSQDLANSLRRKEILKLSKHEQSTFDTIIQSLSS